MYELIQWDQSAFQAINLGCQNAFFDAVMPWLRNKYFWFPVYLFIGSFLLINFQKKGWLVVLSLAFTIGLADVTSSHLLKKTIQRSRPCNVFVAESDIHRLVPCGSGYSFPSSHAANHFAISTFLWWVLGAGHRNLKIALLAWASVVAFAQVYVGLHYPLVVLAGAGVGVLAGRAGFLSWRFWRNKVGNSV